MGRRQLAGRDRKIMQGHRRDAFFAKIKRKGGVARLPNQGAVISEPASEEEAIEEAGAEPVAENEAAAETA